MTSFLSSAVKYFPFFDQLLDHRVLVRGDEAEPGQVEPDLEIKQFLGRKTPGDPGELRRRDKPAAFEQQVVIARDKG